MLAVDNRIYNKLLELSRKFKQQQRLSIDSFVDFHDFIRSFEKTIKLSARPTSTMNYSRLKFFCRFSLNSSFYFKASFVCVERATCHMSVFSCVARCIHSIVRWCWFCCFVACNFKVFSGIETKQAEIC